MEAAAGSAGFDAAVQAAKTLIQRGDRPAPAALGMLARRLAHGAEPPVFNVDLGLYDTLITSTGETA